jgi:uncharacterized protein
MAQNNFHPQGMSDEEFIDLQVSNLTNPWMMYFLNYDPEKALSKVKCPILALNGEKDVQVTADNLIAIEKAVRKGGNTNIAIKKFPNMNHLFQTCETGAIDEYTSIEQTMDPIVLNEISNWIVKQVK